MKSNPSENIERNLSRIRFLKRRVFYVFWSYIPSLLVVGFIGRPFGLTENGLIAAACLYGLVFASLIIPLYYVDCPNCRNKYFRYKSSHNPFAKKCMNCGLSLCVPKNHLGNRS
jgi:hypothetical protein